MRALEGEDKQLMPCAIEKNGVIGGMHRQG